MKDIIIITGIHGSGKSSLAKLFTEKNTQFQYFHEIGGALRDEVTYNVLNSGDAFDQEVMHRELERDSLILQISCLPLIETWHFGNLAYAQTRSPNVFTEYKVRLEEQLQVFRPIPVFIEIGEKTFKLRYSAKIEPKKEDELYQFYLSIRESTLRLYNAYELEPIIIQNERSLQESLQELETEIGLRLNIEPKIPCIQNT